MPQIHVTVLINFRSHNYAFMQEAFAHSLSFLTYLSLLSCSITLDGSVFSVPPSLVVGTRPHTSMVMILIARSRRPRAGC
jgi:hypothetical protein